MDRRIEWLILQVLELDVRKNSIQIILYIEIHTKVITLILQLRWWRVFILPPTFNEWLKNVSLRFWRKFWRRLPGQNLNRFTAWWLTAKSSRRGAVEKGRSKVSEWVSWWLSEWVSERESFGAVYFSKILMDWLMIHCKIELQKRYWYRKE